MSLRINILYGSQNGTARNIAETLEKDLLNENVPASLMELNNYKKAQFTDKTINFIIISTTGDGEPPDNSIDFYNDLISGKKEVCSLLKNKKYGILGLGDSYFTYFCKPAKDIDLKLQEISSVKIVETAYGDDAKNLDEIVENWVKEVKNIVKNSSKIGLETDSISTNSSVEEEKITNIMEGIEITNDDNISESTNSIDYFSEDSYTLSSNDVGEYVIKAENEIENDLEYVPVKLSFDKELLSQITQLKHVIKKPISYLTITSASNLYRSISYSKSQQIFPLIPKKLNSDNNILQYSENNPFSAKVLSTQCLTSKDALKKTVQVTLDITGLNWKYQSGYAFGIIAPNSDKMVLPLLKRLGLDPEDGFRATTTKEALCSGLPVILNKCYTYYEAFKYFININAIPKKAFLRVLAEYCTDIEDKKQLYFLCSSQGASSYRNLKAQYASLLDILYTFKSCHPPFVAILENSTRISPRYYSISSSPLQNSNLISFMFNVHHYIMQNSEDGKYHQRDGLCTGWLDEMLEYPIIQDCIVNFRCKSVNIPIFPKIVNTFVLPPNPLSKNIIMVGAGTGVSPFISFIEYKRQLLEDGQKGDISEEERVKLAEASASWQLFYGCRSNRKDCLIKDYNTLWRQTITNKNIGITMPILDRLEITTSREGNGPKYVQDIMIKPENSNNLRTLLKKRNTYIYVCGNKAMCKGIHEAFSMILQQTTEEAMSNIEAQEYLEILSKEKRYLRDIWG
ncbi:riboflavin synthase domain-like protein [Piromyces finnis]|uniref:Methionine synthase reductase n=1 Tax=Piromyces finnis TaxID=1754191 RepID=A0A1Y1V4T7_9FUNG|nr:riboflavin synthase domain-like protein [Piromyces finnis]|eukprot:ORX47336.1 riboflavin synthase domain-like protein [Piromyces finnis]